MKLSAEGKLRLAARLAFVVGFSTVASSALAQEIELAQAAVPANTDSAAAPADGQAAGNTTAPAGTAAAAGGATQLGGVQVTGSRIRSPNLVGNSPVTVINSAELKYQGTTRVEDLINNLPQAFADQGGNLSNGSNGTATINLRNLGSSPYAGSGRWQAPAARSRRQPRGRRQLHPGTADRPR